MKQPEANVSPAPHEPDEAPIRALYEQLMDGWNRGSADAFAAPFCDDGDLVGFDGTHVRGRAQIVASTEKSRRDIRRQHERRYLLLCALCVLCALCDE